MPELEHTLPMIRMDPQAARAKLLEYRAAVLDAGEKLSSGADRLLAQAFYHASLGRPVISLTAAMLQAGTQPVPFRAQVWRGAGRWETRDNLVQLRPLLAIAPATAQRVWLATAGPSAVFSFSSSDNGNAGQTRTVSKDGKHIQVRWPVHLDGIGPNDRLSPGSPRWAAMVPSVPPALRPQGQGRKPAAEPGLSRGGEHRLAGYHILWEAEWRAAGPPPAPRDPALLKHIGGDLFVVRAVWDLTELERAVLAHPK